MHKLDSDMYKMLDSIPIGMIFFDKNLKMLYCNQRIIDLVGAPSREIFHSNFFVYCPKYQADGSTSQDLAKRILTETMAGSTLEFDWLHKDIKGNLVHVSAVSAQGSYAGEEGVFVYSTDKRALVTLTERMQLMFDTVPLLIDYWTKDYRCVDCNQYALDFYGIGYKSDYLANPMEYAPATQPCGTDSRQKWNAYIDEAFEKGYLNFQFTAQRAPGQLVHYDIIANRVEIDGESLVVTCSKDITERKQMALERSSNQSKSRFLARMSHELRTPISVILGIAEIELQDPSLSIHMDEALAKIHESAAMLLSLVNDILDLSKIEEGKMELIEDSWDVASIVSDIVNVFPTFKGDKPIDFSLFVDENLPVTLHGDFLRIKQILNNLLSNAFKYTESGGISLSFLAKEKSDDYVLLEMVIKDTGMGMSEEMLNNNFKEYTRFHEKERPTTTGTGLGMSIIYNLVKLMGGTVDIESEVNIGTTITIRIHQRIQKNRILGAEHARSLSNLEVNTRTLARKFKFVPTDMPYGKVLIVDDLTANLYVAKGLLSFYSLNIETCISGFEAIEKIRQGNVYDIIFMDQMMPGINGTETLHSMRKLGYNEPVVALTANALIGQAEEFLRQGFDGFISKPINANHLDAILIKYIRDKYPEEVYSSAQIQEAKQESAVADKTSYMERQLEDMEQSLRENFYRTQKNAMEEIHQARQAGDKETFHRKVHNIKGLAGLIREHFLSETAQRVEGLIVSDSVQDEHINTLEKELKIVLSKLQPRNTPEPAQGEFDREVLDIIRPFLVSRNAGCIDYVPKLKVLPEAAILVRQMEDYDFAQAVKSLDTLKSILD